MTQSGRPTADTVRAVTMPLIFELDTGPSKQLPNQTGSSFFGVFFMFFGGIFYGFLAFDRKKPVRITRIGLT